MNTPLHDPERRAWLGERIPRHQARKELLGEIAVWAHEQRVFAAAQVEYDGGEAKNRGVTAGWAVAAIRAAASMAEGVFVQVRMRALAMQQECDAAARQPVRRPVETAQVQEALL